MMEEPGEPQYPVITPQAPPHYPQWVPIAPPGRGHLIRRTTRLLLRRLLYHLALVGRFLRPFAGFVAVIVVLLGVIAWMGILLWWPRSEAPSFQRAESLPPAAGIERFIQGQRNYDANLMWDSYSSAYQAGQLQSGASKATLQAEADNERQAGLHYLRYDYIGGIKLEDGGGMYFYAVDVEIPNQHAKLPFIFTADDDGNIVKISSPLNN